MSSSCRERAIEWRVNSRLKLSHMSCVLIHDENVAHAPDNDNNSDLTDYANGSVRKITMLFRPFWRRDVIEIAVTSSVTSATSRATGWHHDDFRRFTSHASRIAYIDVFHVFLSVILCGLLQHPCPQHNDAITNGYKLACKKKNAEDKEDRRIPKWVRLERDKKK